MAKTHKDVEYAVDDPSGRQKTFKTFDEAAGFAVQQASSNGGKVNIDLLVYSKAGARHVMDDDGVASYEDDPDASVFLRIEVKANNIGHVP